ncbi:MAG TPA: MerR family transcriptional regulator [Kineosporiaceae bacterium]|nr:MerR family transcriptional regulator [Kineosporiaceae bacterium]
MNVQDSSPLTIGEFGRRSGLSIKALRLYDVSGLLRPARTDPVSGYRQYSTDQLDRARRISLLRRLDMPLAVVAEVLSGTDEQAVARLDRWWGAQEAALQARRGTLAWLRGQLTRTEARAATDGTEASAGTGDGIEARARAGDGTLARAETEPHPVHRRRVPATKVAFIRTEVDQQGLLDAIRTAEWEIRQHLDAVGGQATAEHWVLYDGFVAPDSDAPIEVCVPCTGAIEPAGRIAIRLEAAHCEIYTTVLRDDCYYPRIMHAYDAVEAYRMNAGLVPTGPPREIYLAAWSEITGTDPFVHIATPFEEI